jgi:hypothetical protein
MKKPLKKSQRMETTKEFSQFWEIGLRHTVDREVSVEGGGHRPQSFNDFEDAWL